MKISVITLFGILLLHCGCHVQSVSVDHQATSHKLKVVDKVKDQMRLRYEAYQGPSGEEVIEGKFKAWYPSGNKYIDAHYSHGELDGEFVLHSDDSGRKYVGVWKDGKPWDGSVQVGHELRKYKRGKFIATVED